MSILIDTNVLLRSVQPSHPMHAVAVRALETLLKREEPLFVALQNVAEFWNAATRPIANNGLEFTDRGSSGRGRENRRFFPSPDREYGVVFSMEDAFGCPARSGRSGA